jgi:hypothetical protein
VQQHRQHGQNTKRQGGGDLTQLCAYGVNRGGDTDDGQAVEQVAAQLG